jgi:MFS family permease
LAARIFCAIVFPIAVSGAPAKRASHDKIHRPVASAAHYPERASALAAWPVLLASFTILMVAFSFGLFSLPIFYPPLTRQFGWTRAQAAGGGSIVLLLIGILGPVIGKLADRFTPKAVSLGGMCLGAGSLLLLSTSGTLAEFYGYCVLLGVGTSAVSLVPTSMLIAPWFSHRRGLAVGVINAGVGVGGFLAPRLTAYLIRTSGVPQAFLTLAACLAVPFLLTLLLARRAGAPAPANLVHGPAGEAPSTVPAAGLVRTRRFWMIGASLFFSAHTLTGIQQHLALYLTDQSVSAADAALALSALLGASAIGKILGGAIADKYDTRASLLVSIVILVMAIAALLAADPRSAAVYGIAAVFGLGYGGVFNAPPLIAFEYFGTRRVGTILGLFIMFFGLGTSSGGLVAGYIFDSTGRYANSFAWAMASAVMGFVLLFFARPRVQAIP